MHAWGANVASDWPLQPNPPLKDHPHNRAAYAKWLHAQHAGRADTGCARPVRHHVSAAVLRLPRRDGAFLENHCSGFGTNSTPNHLVLVGGQSPTLRNPPRNAAQPLWDMPSILGHAGDHGLSWAAYTGESSYPVAFYEQLKGSPNITRSDQIVADAAQLPNLSMLWHDSPFDEHPVADVTLGHDKIWQAVVRHRPPDYGTTPYSCSPGTTGADSTTMSSLPTSNTRRTVCSWPTGHGCRC